MKKLLLSLLLYIVALNVQAIDKIIADFESVFPLVDTAWSPLVLTRNVDNPNKSGINTSNKVVKIEKAGTGLPNEQNKAYTVVFSSLKLHLYPILKVKLYSSTTVKIQPYLVKSNGEEHFIPYTTGDGVTSGSESTWIQYTLDLSRYLSNTTYKAINFYIEKNDASKAATVYFDDIVLSSLTNADSIVVTSETFGRADCRQRGAGGLNPPFGYPNPSWTSAVASNDAAGVYGNDTWYAKTMYDSLPAGQYVFTTQNGRWADRYSFWASSVLHQNAAFSGVYPNPTVPYTNNVDKQSNALLVAPTGRYSFGWDSLLLENIDISGCKNLSVGFGLLRRDNWLGKRNVFVAYSVDGSNYTLVDTSTYNNFPGSGSSNSVWYFVTANLPNTVKGNKMNLLIHFDPVNDGVRYMLDDVTLSSEYVKVDSIAIQSDNDKVTINKTLQLTSTAFPAEAFEKGVTWSVINGTGQAIIDPVTGLLKGTAVGKVTVVATANDRSGISASKEITVGPTVSSLTIVNPTGVDSINAVGGTLQLTYTATPDDAPDTSVTWSIVKVDGMATITQSGLVKAVSDGVVYAKVVANDGSNISDSLRIVITNQVKPSSITILGGDSITVNDGTLALTAVVSPDSASNKDVIWSISSNDADTAIISADGVVKALRNGKVTVRAKAVADANVFAEKEIVITNQVVELISIALKTAGNATSITTNKGTLQCSVELNPADAVHGAINWSVSDVLKGSINSNGLFTARNNGTVWIKVSVDNFKDSVEIILSNQVVLIESITLQSSTGADSITKANGSLKINAIITPDDATNKTLTWTVNNDSLATVNALGYVFAKANGKVTVTATANDGSGISASIDITIINQPTPTAIHFADQSVVGFYPNPAKEVIYLTNFSKIKKLNIYNIDGRLVYANTNLTSNELNIARLKSGIYTVKFETINNEIIVQQLIIK